MVPLVQRYHEILANRVEGIKKYGGLLASDLYGVPTRLAFPSVSLAKPVMPFVKMGPAFIADRPPILSVVFESLSKLAGPINVVELGPGRGTLAGAVRAAFSGSIDRYIGVERDLSVTGPYEKVEAVDGASSPIHAFIASEVIEHMTVAQFFEDTLPTVVERMAQSGVAIIGTPNALGPTAIFNDFTHVQGYNCFDLYALMRLYFDDVSMYRTRYVWSAERLLTLLPRVVLCRALELDWCEGLICVARSPRLRS